MSGLNGMRWRCISIFAPKQLAKPRRMKVRTAVRARRSEGAAGIELQRIFGIEPDAARDLMREPGDGRIDAAQLELGR